MALIIKHLVILYKNVLYVFFNVYLPGEAQYNIFLPEYRPVYGDNHHYRGYVWRLQKNE